MNKSKLIYIGMGVVVLALVVIYLFTDFNKLAKNKEQPPKNINWNEKYSPKGKSPYDTYVFYELLKEYTKKKFYMFRHISKQYEKPINNNNNPAIYVAIGKNIYLDYDNCSNLTKFVEEGNYAFIAAETLPYDIDYILTNVSLKVKNKWRLKTELNFIDTLLATPVNYKFYYYNYSEIFFHTWSYFDKLLEHDEDELTLEYSDTNNLILDSLIYTSNQPQYEVLEIQENNHAVFVKIKYGKGAFYFHSVPICFTNISLLKERNLQHAEKVLSYLPDGDIIWDKYAPLEFKHNYNINAPNKRESPLQFILRNPPLRWAFYIMLAAVFIYIIFRIKRKQRIIPPLEDKENTSIEFAETLSGIYMQQQKHKSIALHMRKIWLHYIREKYNITLSNNDTAFVNLLIKKSGITEEKIQRLYHTFEKTQKINSITDKELINLHEQLEYFYINCN